MYPFGGIPKVLLPRSVAFFCMRAETFCTGWHAATLTKEKPLAPKARNIFVRWNFTENFHETAIASKKLSTSESMTQCLRPKYDTGCRAFSVLWAVAHLFQRMNDVCLSPRLQLAVVNLNSYCCFFLIYVLDGNLLFCISMSYYEVNEQAHPGYWIVRRS